MKMMDPIESKVLDINSEAYGIRTDQLMTNAGNALADEINMRYPGGKISIICGTGNNGGDGFVAARKLHELGRDVIVLLVKGKDDVRGEVARYMLQQIEGKIQIMENARPEDIGEAEIILDSNPNIISDSDPGVILDSMLGTGMKGNIREPFRAWIEAINASSKIIISTDIPSGLGADICVKPAMTITFHDVKDGMDAVNSGEIIIIDIGIPKEAVDIIGLGEFEYYPRPSTDSHKGENGRLLIIGGGPYTGAAALAGLAAYRVGADLVTIATPENCFVPIASYSPNFIVRPLSGNIIQPEHVEDLLEMAENKDAVLIGPGIGRDNRTLIAVREFLAKIQKPVVVDADALTAISGHLDLFEKVKSHGVLTPHGGVLTPHSGEFQKLVEDLEDASIKKLADKVGLTVILKGKTDLVSDGRMTKKNLTGNPAMTVGGTGDVLAGLVAGLVAKEIDPFAAARMGVFISGAAGDNAFEKLGYSLTAIDIIEEVPMVLKTCLKM